MPGLGLKRGLSRDLVIAPYATVLALAVDPPAAAANFAALAAESRQTGAAWTMVFAAGLGGRNGQPPASSEIDAALQLMVEAVRDGGFARFAAYDSEGDPVVFD